MLNQARPVRQAQRRRPNSGSALAGTMHALRTLCSPCRTDLRSDLQLSAHSAAARLLHDAFVTAQ